MLEYRELTSDYAGLSELFGDTFGVRNDQAALNQKMLEDECCRVLAALENKALVGVSVVRIAPPAHELPSYVSFGEAASVLRGRPLGTFNVMAISPSHKRRGIATSLGTQQLAWLRERGAELLLGISWQHGDGDCSALRGCRLFKSCQG
ncbi:MAG: GNAT family N-acetyltransferase [Myxococcales bacterium]|nr:GNAT family N-acetyltransferase [Myxococcales bacterium]